MKDRKAPKTKHELDPESEAWKAILWRKLEQYVFRIQKRIYRASQQGKTRTGQKLQKLLMKSEAARLLAVRRVTQDNQGKKTAGGDGVKSVQPAERMVMAKRIHPNQWKRHKTRPVRRVWIPKPGKDALRPLAHGLRNELHLRAEVACRHLSLLFSFGKQALFLTMDQQPMRKANRPVKPFLFLVQLVAQPVGLGIPVLLERAQQALVKSALEPEWEARFEGNSYGFRPGRSAHDAIVAIWNALRYKGKFVLDADIAGCFDAINQEELLKKLKTFPQMRQIIKAWLKAGVIDNDVFTPTEAGTPQGGVISPLLANIALHGMEAAITEGMKYREIKPILVRYADDFVILHPDKEVLEKATQKITDWLKHMGLVLSPKKTRVTHTLNPYEGNVGFDFLGYTVRQFSVGKTHTGKDTKGQPLGYKTINKPSKKAIKTHIQKTNHLLKKLKSAPQKAVVGKLNPVIKGWCTYHKVVCAKKVFHRCDSHLYVQLMEWGRKRHHNKGKTWIYQRYWHREDGKRWVFAAPVQTEEGVGLLKLRRHNQTAIQRHIKVRGTASPYDGNLVYWSQRLKHHPLMDSARAKLLQIQKGMCPRCGLYFQDEDVLEIDHIVPVALGGKDTLANKWVYHRHCHDEKTAEDMARMKAMKAAGVNIKRP